jgi:hypothetical protein
MNNTETLITILDDDEAKKRRQKGIPRSGGEGEFLARRIQPNEITFYDLAQVNVGTVDNPVWNDHQILKTPSYTATAQISDNFLGCRYVFEDFGNSDYQSFTDSIFAVGNIQEWKHLFKKLELELNSIDSPGFDADNFSFPATYPVNLMFEDKNHDRHRAMEVYINSDIDTPLGKANREELLDLYGMFWDKKGLEYKGLDSVGYSGNVYDRDWFSCDSNGLPYYKVTDVYDFDAPDKSGIIIKGKIEVYLMPQVGFFMAVGSKAPTLFDYTDPFAGFNVLFAYQVLPRFRYPKYVDPYNWFGNYALHDDFLNYQSVRSGMSGSNWYATGTPSIPTGIVESSITPLNFFSDILSYKWHFDNGAINSFYTSGSRTYNGNTGSARFIRTDPFLMAVIKANGKFYYVWVPEGDEFGNQASFETRFSNTYELSSPTYEE